MQADQLRRIELSFQQHGVSEAKLKSIRLQDLLRYFEPWPDWVFNIGAEVFAVHFPSVSKQTFTAILKNIHWLIFEAKIKGECSPPPPFNLPPDFENEFLRFMGHMSKHLDILEEQLLGIDTAEISPELRLKIDKLRAENPKKRKKLAKLFLNYLAKRGNQIDTIGVVLDANRATLDSKGRIRETRATAIYKKILFSWPEVESLAGTKELCLFLEPLLDSNDALVNLERVKKIVQRMGIVFRPKLSIDIQGTS